MKAKLFWTDLNYQAQEDIRRSVEEYIRGDMTLEEMKEIEATAEEEGILADDLINELIDDRINKEFSGEYYY
jgi:hypothetical protein